MGMGLLPMVYQEQLPINKLQARSLVFRIFFTEEDIAVLDKYLFSGIHAEVCGSIRTSC